MNTESMRKRAEKLASLWVRRSEILHELEEVDREIDRVQQWGGYEGDDGQTQSRARSKPDED